MMVDSTAAPSLVVCMPVYNAEEYLARCMQSILSQTFGDFHFWLYIDGVTDRSREIAASFKDPRVTIFDNAKNRGVIHGRNTMLAKALRAGYRYMALMDADDHCDRKRFAKQLEVLNYDIGLSICGSSVLAERTRTIWKANGQPSKVKVDCIFHNPIPTPSAVIRLDTVRRLSEVWNSEYSPCADYEYWSRLLLQHSVRATNIEEPLLTYTFNRAGVSWADGRKKQLEREVHAKIKNFEYYGVKCDIDDAKALTFAQQDAKLVPRFAKKRLQRLAGDFILKNVESRQFAHDYLIHRFSKIISKLD